MTTIGDHIRKRRLDLGLFQQQVGKLIGADEATIKNWETHATEPMIHCLSKIIEFLGYNPLPLVQTLSERIIRCRRTLGLSRRELSRRLGVDEGTLWRWEAGMRQPTGRYLEMVRALL